MPHKRRKGSISRTPQGSYIARVRTPPDPSTGKRGGRSRVFETEPEAEEWLAKILGGTLDESFQTFESFLVGFYTRPDQVRINANTARKSLDMLRAYVFRADPKLSQTALCKVTSSQLHALFRALAKRRLDDTTVGNVRRILHARLNDAVNDWLIERHPLAAAGGMDSGVVNTELAYRNEETEEALRDIYVMLTCARAGTYAEMIAGVLARIARAIPAEELQMLAPERENAA